MGAALRDDRVDDVVQEPSDRVQFRLVVPAHRGDDAVDERAEVGPAKICRALLHDDVYPPPVATVADPPDVPGAFEPVEQAGD
jgi:hypothetical protein